MKPLQWKGDNGMATGNGYLSRVVSDAYRPMHGFSRPHGIKAGRGDDRPSVTGSADTLSAHIPLPAKRLDAEAQAMHKDLPLPKQMEQRSEAVRSAGKGEANAIRLTVPLQGEPADWRENDASEEIAVTDAAAGEDMQQHRPDGTVITTQNVDTILAGDDAMEHGDTEHAIDFPIHSQMTAEQQQRERHHLLRIDKSVDLGAHHMAVLQGTDRITAQRSNRITAQGTDRITAGDTALQILQKMQKGRADVASEQRADRKASALYDSSEEQSSRRPGKEAKLEDQMLEARLHETRLSEARLHETRPLEHASAEPVRLRRPEPTASAPQVHIGQVDVIVLAESNTPANRSAPAVSDAFSSRNYLRRL